MPKESSEIRSFHHGNLHAAALAEALKTVRTCGAAELSLRALAQATGVNHRALYRHFADKDAVLNAVAAEGFRMLSGQMTRSLPSTGTSADPRAGVLDTYIAFALKERHLYSLMFGLPATALFHEPQLAEAVKQVIRIAASAFRQTDDPPGPSDALRDRVIAAWGLAHGLCDLWLRGGIRARNAAEAHRYIQRVILQTLGN